MTLFTGFWSPTPTTFIRPKHRNALPVCEAMFLQWPRKPARDKRRELQNGYFSTEWVFSAPYRWTLVLERRLIQAQRAALAVSPQVLRAPEAQGIPKVELSHHEKSRLQPTIIFTVNMSWQLFSFKMSWLFHVAIKWHTVATMLIITPWCKTTITFFVFVWLKYKHNRCPRTHVCPRAHQEAYKTNSWWDNIYGEVIFQ